MADRLLEIFARQETYCESLHPILSRNQIPWWRFPLELNNRHHQEQLRLLAWRCTEEVTEALWGHKPGCPHFNEEVADALHFLVELTIASGVTEYEILTNTEDPGKNESPDADYLQIIFDATKATIIEEAYKGDYEEDWCQFIIGLGCTMQLLKQRPWRTDDRKTKRSDWVESLHLTWYKFVHACLVCNIEADDLYNAYFAKSKINDQRTAAQQL